MRHLVLNPSAKSQWFELVREAEKASRQGLDDELRNYLVLVLMNYTGTGRFAGSIVALEYLRGLSMTGRAREYALSAVGDKCLLLSGLFPGLAERRRVRISYYIQLGASAYAVLADLSGSCRGALYNGLARHFINLREVLHAARELGDRGPALEPLQAMELWNDSGSPRGLANLRAYTQGTPVRDVETEEKAVTPRGGTKKHYH